MDLQDPEQWLENSDLQQRSQAEYILVGKQPRESFELNMSQL